MESIAHVTTPPDTTSLYWLLNLMSAPPPWRLVVHIHARDRAKTRRHYRLRWRRIWAGLQRKQREAKLISPEEFEQEREAGEIDAELRLSASGVYDVSILHSQRAAAERVELLDDERRAIAREMEGATDARLYGGRFLGERSLVSCLPLGTNALRATRGFASRNIADCVPLLSTSASSRGGVPIGYAIPGNTLERIDLFDPAYRTHVALITGASGGGKTVFVNTTLMRSIARGAQGMIVDRSSSEDAETGIREAGHYEALVDLVPGAEKLHFGADRHDAVLCPWDVPDPARVSSEKVRFLLALHTLLIGDPGRDSDERELSGEDRSLLERGIQRVYDVCAESERAPARVAAAARAARAGPLRGGALEPGRRSPDRLQVPRPRRPASLLLRGRRPRLARRRRDHDPRRVAAAALRPRGASLRPGRAGDAHPGRPHGPGDAAAALAPPPRQPPRTPGPGPARPSW